MDTSIPGLVQPAEIRKVIYLLADESDTTKRDSQHACRDDVGPARRSRWCRASEL